MKIRFGTREDIEVILTLSSELHAESRFKERSIDQKKTRGVIESMLANPAQACILLAQSSDGEIVGLLAGVVMEYFFTQGVMAQDRCFYVQPASRGSSAAVKLLMAFRKWAELRKADELCVNMSVAIDVDRFNKLMTHMGFNYCGSNFSFKL